QTVIAENVAVVPELLDECGGVAHVAIGSLGKTEISGARQLLLDRVSAQIESIWRHHCHRSRGCIRGRHSKRLCNGWWFAFGFPPGDNTVCRICLAAAQTDQLVGPVQDSLSGLSSFCILPTRNHISPLNGYRERSRCLRCC